MTLAPDLLIRDTIVAALALLRERDDLVDQVFDGHSETTRAEVKEYLAATRIDVRLGWTQASTAMPVIAVTLPGEQESSQYVGSEPGEFYDGEVGDFVDSAYVDQELGAWVETQIAQFSGSCDAAIYALNGTETSWLSAMIKWAFLRYRRPLEESGFFEQRINVTDFMPASEYPQPDPAYTRVVKIQYQVLAEYTYDDFDPDSTVTAHDHEVVLLNNSEP